MRKCSRGYLAIWLDEQKTEISKHCTKNYIRNAFEAVIMMRGTYKPPLENTNIYTFGGFQSNTSTS